MQEYPTRDPQTIPALICRRKEAAGVVLLFLQDWERTSRFKIAMKNLRLKGKLVGSAPMAQMFGAAATSGLIRVVDLTWHITSKQGVFRPNSALVGIESGA